MRRCRSQDAISSLEWNGFRSPTRGAIAGVDVPVPLR